MNLYQLENKVQDDQFLAGGIVQCRVAIAASDAGDVRQGASLVVQLSNRKKYKGRIVSVSFLVKGKKAEGSIEIQRQ